MLCGLLGVARTFRNESSLSPSLREYIGVYVRPKAKLEIESRKEHKQRSIWYNKSRNTAM